jgi:molybdopterin-binding protein
VRISARNNIPGTIISIHQGNAVANIVLDVAGNASSPQSRPTQ